MRGEETFHNMVPSTKHSLGQTNPGLPLRAIRAFPERRGCFGPRLQVTTRAVVLAVRSADLNFSRSVRPRLNFELVTR